MNTAPCAFCGEAFDPRDSLGRNKRRTCSDICRKAHIEKQKKDYQAMPEIKARTRDQCREAARRYRAKPEKRALEREQNRRRYREQVATPEGRADLNAARRALKKAQPKIEARQNEWRRERYASDPENRARRTEDNNARFAASPAYQERARRYSRQYQREALAHLRMLREKGYVGPMSRKEEAKAIPLARRLYREMLATEQKAEWNDRLQVGATVGVLIPA